MSGRPSSFKVLARVSFGSLRSFGKQIQSRLLAARFSTYLQGILKNADFKDIASRYVELVAEARSAEEHRILDSLISMPNASPSFDAVETSKLPAETSVTVIEAEPGAGKTWALGFLAWQHADKFLSAENSVCRIPVYLELKLLAYQGSGHTIATTIQHELNSCIGPSREIPWDSLLLLVDGLNEVAPQAQANFKAELKDLLAKHPTLHVVVTRAPEFVPW